MLARFGLTVRVDEEPLVEAGRCRVREELVQVGVLDTGDVDPFVLAVANEVASTAGPPRQVGLEAYTFGFVEVEPPALRPLGQGPFVDAELFA